MPTFYTKKREHTNVQERNNMNTNKLQSGMIIKNYREFCKLTDEPIKSGKSKRLQLADWTRYFDFHKSTNSQSYIIDQVYDEPYPEEEFRKDVVYSKLIQYILAERLAIEETTEIDMTKRQLYLYLGMVNSSYINDVEKQAALDIFYEKHQDNMTPEQSFYYYNDFSIHTNRRLDSIIENALSSMEERKLIIKNKRYKIIETVIEDNKKVPKMRQADNNEMSIIIDIIREYLDEHPEFSFINAYNYKRYYGGLNKIFKERMGWDSVYQSIQIIFGEDSIKKYVTVLGDELLEECKKNQVELNSVIVERLNKHFQVAYQNNRNKLIKAAVDQMSVISSDWTDEDIIERIVKSDEKLKKKLYADNYVEIQQEFVDLFVDTKGIFEITTKPSKLRL